MQGIRLTPGRQLAAAEGRGALPVPRLGGPHLPSLLPGWRCWRRGKGVLWHGGPAQRTAFSQHAHCVT